MEKTSKKKNNVLVLNAGSSSLKVQVFDLNTERILFNAEVDSINKPHCSFRIYLKTKKIREPCRIKTHREAIQFAIKKIKDRQIIEHPNEIAAIGHRVVHGGEKYKKSCIITKDVVKSIKSFSKLAPLHNPHNLAGILACQKLFPKVKQFAVFDTSFHHTIPQHAFLYGIPSQIYKKYGVRKYGFHGISHEYVSRQAAKLLQRSKKSRKNKSKIITCHLGNGSSITAVRDGKSIDTSMGFTPLDGLIMGTRSGHLDPGIVPFLIDRGYKNQDIKEILYKKSGLKAISGVSSDMRNIINAASKGNKNAKLAIDMLAYRTAMLIGSYAAVLKGVDCIVFTAGIGENSYLIRKKVCDFLGYLGIRINANKNRSNSTVISTQASKVKVFVIPTNEAFMILHDVKRLLNKK